MKACKNCHLIVDDKIAKASKDKCLKCGGQLSKDWQGYVIVVDHTKSHIAKKMNIKFNGQFALKVR